MWLFGILRPVKIISLILSRISRKVGRKWEIPEKKTPDHQQTELGLSHMWPELGSNPQPWDDKPFRVLKISAFNQSTMGAAFTCFELSQIGRQGKTHKIWGKPPDPSVGRMWLSHMKSSWWQTVILGTDILICTSLSLKILLFSHM